MMNKVLKSILRKDFKSFVIKCFQECSGITPYNDNWHINVICNAINDMMDGKNRQLILNVPPRHLKSIICSMALPAFLLGHNPKTSIICVSYSDELSGKLANDCRNIMQSDWYQEIFPRTKLQPSRRSINDFTTTLGGGRYATSVGGAMTGRGAEWIIIDDPLKPNEVTSDIQREKVNEWFGTTVYSRLNDKATGRILVIMQRLHQNDLTGFLLDSDYGFKHIKLQAIATEHEHWEIHNRITGQTRVIERQIGDLLHPSRENWATIDDIRQKLGSFAFAGQYQQDPVPVEGGIIKESWLHYDNKSTFNRNDVLQILLSWDTASKTGAGNAYSACVVIVITKDRKLHLVDVYRDKWEMPELVKKAKEIYLQWHANLNAGNRIKILVEDAASGIALIQFLATERDGRYFNVEPIKPHGDKISRLVNGSVVIESGHLLFPKEAEQHAWWSEFKKELLGFPGTKYKDQVDALSQAINYATLII